MTTAMGEYRSSACPGWNSRHAEENQLFVFILFSFQVELRPGDSVAGGTADFPPAQRHPGQGAEAGRAGAGEWEQPLCLRQEQAGEGPQPQEVSWPLGPKS